MLIKNTKPKDKSLTFEESLELMITIGPDKESSIISYYRPKRNKINIAEMHNI